MKSIQDEQKAWLREVLAKTGITATSLAAKCGLAQTTLTRFLNVESYANALSARTVERIEKFSGVPFGRTRGGEGVVYAEAAPVARKANDLIACAIGDSNEFTAWTLQSQALENSGFREGDIFLVDESAAPAEGDIVRVEFKSYARDANSAFRIYEPPFLLADTSDTGLRKPMLIGQGARVAGVAVASIRPLKARAA